MLDSVDEEERSADDHAERHKHLDVDDSEAWVPLWIPAVGTAVHAMKAQRREVDRIDLRVGDEMSADVPGVDADDRDHCTVTRPRELGRYEGCADGDPVGNEEIADVQAKDVGVNRHLAASGPPLSPEKDSEAGHKHRQCREHEGCAEDCPDSDLMTSIRVARPCEQDRDERNHGFGQGRAYGRKNAADGTLGQVQLVAEPLDAVGEQLGGNEYDDERDAELEELHQLLPTGAPVSVNSKRAGAPGRKAAAQRGARASMQLPAGADAPRTCPSCVGARSWRARTGSGGDG